MDRRGWRYPRHVDCPVSDESLRDSMLTSQRLKRLILFIPMNGWSKFSMTILQHRCIDSRPRGNDGSFRKGLNSKEKMMATLKIFVSFEFDKDKKLRGDFYGQAKTRTQHRVRNFSLRESYPTDEWKKKASEAIRGCDVVVVLIGKDTHNAPGVKVETDMARSFNKRVIQVRHKRQTYKGLRGLCEPIPWKWKRINAELDKIQK